MSDTKRKKSNMQRWAEEEIRIACERERRNGTPEGEWDYGVACYESALKAFKSLMEDEHTGFSIAVTLDILNKLVKIQPLTPIEDTDDVWIKCGRYPYENDYITYQCKRMSSLFKHVYTDGHIEYSDVNRFSCRTLGSSAWWHNGHVSKIANEYFPIKMPYMPHTYNVVCEELLTDRKNGDFDTMAILYIYNSAGERKEVNRCFAETEEGWREIDPAEYVQRKRKANAREEAEAANVEKK